MFANESGNVNSECSFGKSTTLRNNIETFPYSWTSFFINKYDEHI